MKSYFSGILLFSYLLCWSQETVQDSILPEKLEEVIVTGQINPQAVDKSVVEVKVLNRDIIERQAGNTLADVLATTLNLAVLPQTSNGRSEVSLFGLNNEYFKVLVDNIPLVNEEGSGNNTDLSTINLDDIERIEIVEGAMGVQYGANAFTGVINIITKKNSKYKWEINAYSQQETIGNEFGFFDEGRHIQSLRLGHNFNEKWHANAGISRNDFNGFLNNRRGRDYELSDGLRGFEWLPKEQLSARGTVSFKDENINVFYRFEFLDEEIDRVNENVDQNFNSSTQTSNPSAIDEILSNNRMVHHINATGKLLEKYNFNVSLSYQEQEQDLERFVYRIRTEEKENVTKLGNQSRETIFSRGTLSNLFQSEKFSAQGGYELSLEEGTGSLFTLFVSPGEEGVAQELRNYDFFGAAEWTVNNKLTLRPGFRFSTTNLFQPQYIGSLSAKYDLGNKWSLRGVLGSANKTPSYAELFTFFVDVNHDVRGNINLNPERGVSAFLHLKKSFNFVESDIRLKSKLSASHINLRDKIELIEINRNPLQYQFNNIDRFKAFIAFIENDFYYKNIKASIGASSQWRATIFKESAQPNENYLFSFQLNSNLKYSIPNWDTDISLFYKFTGEQPRLRQSIDEDGEQIFIVGRNGSFGFLDMTLRKGFKDNQFIATLGARNLLNVTDINTSALDGGTHNGDPTALAVAYGTSVFLKLAYNLKI
jgi:outer membrane receptor for ferrienterochelin and colicins